MLKKSLIIGSALLVFTGCTTVKNETPEQVLLKNQTQLIEKIEKYSYPVSLGTVKTDALIDIKSNEGDISLKINSDFDFDKLKNAFSGDILTDIFIKSPIASGSGNINISTVLSEKVFYLKLNGFDVSIPGQDGVELAKMMVSQYIGKWINIDFDKKEAAIMPTGLLSLNDLTKVYKKYEVLKSIKVNEDKDFYNYEVSLNEENIVKIADELLKLKDKEAKITEEQIAEIKKELKAMSFSGNIKVETKNKEYFVFSGKIEDVNIELTNNKEVFMATVSSEGSKASLDFKKTSKGTTGTITLLEGEDEVLKSNLDIEVSSKSFNILGDFTFDGATSKIDIKNTFEAKKDITINAPKGATALEELMQGLMGGFMGADSMGNVIESGSGTKNSSGTINEMNLYGKNANIDTPNEGGTNKEELEKALDSDEVKEAMNEIEGLTDLEGLEDLLK